MNTRPDFTLSAIDALHDLAQEVDFVASAVAALGNEGSAGLSAIITRWSDTLVALADSLADKQGGEC